MWAGNCPEWVLLEFAAALAGLTLVTVNPAYQADELAHVLGRSRARAVFLADRYRGKDLPAILASVRDRLPGLRETTPLREWDALCATAPARVVEAELAGFCRARLAAYKVPVRWLGAWHHRPHDFKSAPSRGLCMSPPRALPGFRLR